MSTKDRLPRADEAERYLITCILGWPERAPEFVPLLKPTEFFDTLHQRIWKSFKTQLVLTGSVDAVAVSRECDCRDYFLTLGQDIATTAHTDSRAEMVREAARARALHDLLSRGDQAVLNGRPTYSVLAQLDMALDGFKQGATA